MPFWAILLCVIGGLLIILLGLWLVCEIDSRKRRKRHRITFEQTIYEQEKVRAENTLATLRAANIARANNPAPAYPQQHHPTHCQHGFVNPTYQQQNGEKFYCPECYDTMTPAEQYQPVSPYSATQQDNKTIPLYQIQPVNYSPQVVNYPAQPVNYSSQVVNYPAQPNYIVPQQEYLPHQPLYTTASNTPPGRPILANEPTVQWDGTMQTVGIIPTNIPTTVELVPQFTHKQYDNNDNAKVSGGGRLRLAETDDEIPTSPPPIAPVGFVTVPMIRDRS